MLPSPMSGGPDPFWGNGPDPCNYYSFPGMVNCHEIWTLFHFFLTNCFVLVETEKARVNEIGLLKGPSLGMNEKCIFLNE